MPPWCHRPIVTHGWRVWAKTARGMRKTLPKFCKRRWGTICHSNLLWNIKYVCRNSSSWVLTKLSVLADPSLPAGSSFQVRLMEVIAWQTAIATGTKHATLYERSAMVSLHFFHYHHIWLRYFGMVCGMGENTSNSSCNVVWEEEGFIGWFCFIICTLLCSSEKRSGLKLGYSTGVRVNQICWLKFLQKLHYGFQLMRN